MPEGRIAGGQPEVVNTPTIERPTQAIDTPHEVAVDVLRYFNTDYTADGKTLDLLKEISEWTFKDVETVGDGMLKLKHLEIKLGQPTGNESRIDKIHRWIALQKHIDDLMKRQEAL
jgi:hypothetical protein